MKKIFIEDNGIATVSVNKGIAKNISRINLRKIGQFQGKNLW
jgi:hypothetical protein